MKWFKHSVHARSEHGIEDILRCHGPAGIGIYWCLLEMLAKDTERFRLRIAGISAEADERFEQARTKDFSRCPADHLYRIDLLARTLNTEPERIIAVVSLGVSEGLFDRDLWLTYSILHSPGFCHQADEYTRRLRTILRTHSPGCRCAGPYWGDSPENSGESPERLRRTRSRRDERREKKR